MTWLKPILELLSAISSFFRDRQMLDAGADKQKVKQYEANSKAQKQAQALENDIASATNDDLNSRL